MRNLLVACLFSTRCGTSTAAGADTLAELKDQYRVIVVFAPTDTEGADTRDSLKRATGITERDIAGFVVTPGSIRSNIGQAVDREALLKLHDLDGFEAVLVGKDGTLDVSDFFQAIDAMPMRQREMQSSQ